MTSSRLILIFLGFIFVIIVILTSSRIAGSLRSRFGGFFPTVNTTTTEEISATPPPPAETPAPAPITPPGKEKVTSTPGGTIPATGPPEIMWFLLGASFLSGLSLRKFPACRGGKSSTSR